jgi:hypothetical protein
VDLTLPRVCQGAAVRRQSWVNRRYSEFPRCQSFLDAKDREPALLGSKIGISVFSGAMIELLSAVHAKLLLHIAPIARSSPPDTGLIDKLAVRGVPQRKNAIHFPSGDHLGDIGRSPSANGRGFPPLKDFKYIPQSSLFESGGGVQRKAIVFPSGDMAASLVPPGKSSSGVILICAGTAAQKITMNTRARPISQSVYGNVGPLRRNCRAPWRDGRE